MTLNDSCKEGFHFVIVCLDELKTNSCRYEDLIEQEQLLSNYK